MSSRTGDVGRHLERFLQDMRNHMPLLEAEAQHIKELQRESDSKLFKNAQEENKKLAEENEDLKRSLRALKAETRQRENEDAKKHERDEKTKNMHAKMSKEIERLSRQCEETETMVKERFKEEIDVLVAEKRSLEEKCDEQKHQIQQFEEKVRDVEEKEHDRHQLESKYKKVRNKLEDTAKELEETKVRLSELMGHQLSDKNPNIADLSDQNRPTKLGEMFSSLYDDEYTDAFEALNTGNDRETCKTLLDLLLDAKKFCDRKAEEQLRGLKRECLGQDNVDTSMVDYSLKEMKEVRKKNAIKSSDAIYEKFVSHMRYTSVFKNPYLHPKTTKFAKKCVELCWLMAVQDPPLVFGPLPRWRDKFNADLYREYTKSGTRVDFTVWPVLHLYENGPVLSKGVVEPIKEGWTDNRTEFRNYRALDQEQQCFDTDGTDIQQRYRDLDVDQSSKPLSAVDTHSYEPELDNLFKSDRYRGGGFSGRSETEPDYFTARSTRHTSSGGYRQIILPTTRHRHSPEKFLRPSSDRQLSSGLHEKGWRY